MEKHVKELLTEEVLVAVAQFYEIERNELMYVGGFENYIYGFKKNQDEFVVRLTHTSHRDLAEVEGEIDFLFYLARHQAKVSTPIHNCHHQLVGTISCLDGSSFMVTAFTKAKGEPPSKLTFNDELIFNYGKTIGEFHQLAKNYHPSSERYQRRRWDQDSLIVEAKKYLPASEAFVLNRLDQLLAQIRTIAPNKDNFGLIHGDIHMGNFFVSDNELTVFDFDDASYHYFASDIAIALFYLVFMKKVDEQEQLADHFMAVFMKGYQSVHQLPYQDYLTIPLFLKLRELVLYIVIYRTLDVQTDPFAKAYLARYREHILRDEAFICLDFSKYYG